MYQHSIDIRQHTFPLPRGSVWAAGYSPSDARSLLASLDSFGDVGYAAATDRGKVYVLADTPLPRSKEVAAGSDADGILAAMQRRRLHCGGAWSIAEPMSDVGGREWLFAEPAAPLPAAQQPVAPKVEYVESRDPLYFPIAEVQPIESAPLPSRAAWVAARDAYDRLSDADLYGPAGEAMRGEVRRLHAIHEADCAALTAIEAAVIPSPMSEGVPS